jgi:hypothetical protein
MTLQRQSTRVLLCTFLVLLLAGCATTRQTRKAETAGFLGDYSMLRAGEGEEAQLVYVKPGVDWSGYNAVMLDSVTIWRSGPESLSEESSRQLTDYFYQALHDEISKEFHIVKVPGPGVLRLRAALTEAKGARVVGNAVTSIVPQARLVSSLLGAATDVQVFVGRASAEAEFTDAVSGERLLAAVDQRSGTKAIRGGIAKWSDVKLACDHWAGRVRERLGELGVKRTH